MNDPDSITTAAQKTSDVEIVINNAGMLNIANPLASNAVSAMQEEMEVNVYGLMRMAQAFAPVLKANGGGALVQLNSVGSMKSIPDFATYTASKAASYSITQALREILQAQGTRVVSVPLSGVISSYCVAFPSRLRNDKSSSLRSADPTYAASQPHG